MKMERGTCFSKKKLPRNLLWTRQPLSFQNASGALGYLEDCAFLGFANDLKGAINYGLGIAIFRDTTYFTLCYVFGQRIFCS